MPLTSLTRSENQGLVPLVMRPFPPETKKPALVPQNRSCNCSNTHAIIYKMMKVFKGLVSLFMRRFLWCSRDS